MPSQDEIYTKVSATLVEALNVEEDEIKPDATLHPPAALASDRCR